MGLRTLLLHYLQNRDPNRTRHVVATKRAEEFHPIIKRLGNRTRRDYSTNRMAIADRFAEHNDVRNYFIHFKTIEMCADPPVSGLNLIRNTNAAGPAYCIVNSFQITMRQDDLPGDAWQRLSDEATA